MATKTVEIQPAAAAAAGCFATDCTSYASGSTETLAAITTFTNFEAEATAVGAWVFQRWEVYYHIERNDGTETEDVVYNDPWNPVPQNKITTSPQNPTEYTTTFKPQYATPYQVETKQTITRVVARFRNTHVPTNLLVNSFNRNGSSPVRLVYDDRAGHAAQLVADY